MFCLSYFAGLVVHVEGDNSVRGQGSALQQQQVSGQLIGQVCLSCPAGARQDDAAVLPQQGDVSLQHRLGDQSVEDERVHALTPHTWKHTQRWSKFLKYIFFYAFSPLDFGGFFSRNSTPKSKISLIHLVSRKLFSIGFKTFCRSYNHSVSFTNKGAGGMSDSKTTEDQKEKVSTNC